MHKDKLVIIFLIISMGILLSIIIYKQTLQKTESNDYSQSVNSKSDFDI